MIRISLAEKAASAGCGFKEHSITPGVGRAVGYAMLDHVNVDAGSKGPYGDFLFCTLDDLFNCEIFAIRVFAVEEGGSNPGFIGNFQ